MLPRRFPLVLSTLRRAGAHKFTVTHVLGHALVNLVRAGDWWSDAAWPAEADPLLKPYLGALSHGAAFAPLALRTRLPSTPDGQTMAFLRYDATKNGSAALAVFNLQGSPTMAHVDLSALPSGMMGTAPHDLIRRDSAPPLTAQYAVALDAYGVALMELANLSQWKSLGALNCYGGRGAAYAPSSSGNMPLAACMLECLQDAHCTAITVGWLPVGSHATHVSCYKRGGVKMSQCAAGGSEYSTLAVSSR